MMRCVSLLMIVSLAGVATALGAGVTIVVVPSSAPNGYGSPSWSGYMANAMTSLGSGGGNIGDRSTSPTAYEVAGGTIEPGDIMVTSFKSWRGTLNPVGAFASELGNRLHFGLHAVGDGNARFCLEDLTFELHSSDPSDTLLFTGDFLGYGYTGTSRYGVDWGTDRTPGTADDTVYATGNGTTLVDEIVYVGVGNAWWPGGDDPTPSNPAGGAQAALDDTVAWIAANYPINVSCSYSIQTYTGSASVVVLPEPATTGLLALGGLCLARRRRR